MITAASKYLEFFLIVSAVAISGLAAILPAEHK